MAFVETAPSPRETWQPRVGIQRDWCWRGWQIRYSYWRGPSDRPPVLLLHGFGAALEHWRHNIPVLARSRSVYALDLLGFGASRKVTAPFTVGFWAELVREFWQTFVGRPGVAIGNSLGSLVALELAAVYPETVAGLVAISLPDVSRRTETLPPWALSPVQAIEGAVASPPILKLLLRFLRRREAIRAWAGVAYSDRAAVTDELVEILARPAADVGAGDALAALAAATRDPAFSVPVRDRLPQVSAPILLLWGTRDRMVPCSLAQAYLGLNPGLEYVELEDAGHCPHDESAERVHAVLLPWLETHCGPPPLRDRR